MLLLLDIRREREGVDGTNENPSAEGAKRRRRVAAARIMVIACRWWKRDVRERTSRSVPSRIEHK